MRLAHGVVVDADGSPQADAIVVLDQDTITNPRLHYFVRTDNEGRYEVFGEQHGEFVNLIWAATEDGKLGARWLPLEPSDEPLEITLVGGDTQVMVVDADCQPKPGVRVELTASSVELIREPLPPNLRDYFRRVTDSQGRVEYPSGLGGDLLEFTAANQDGAPQTTTVSFDLTETPARRKLIVLGGNDETLQRCRKLLQPEDPQDEVDAADDLSDRESRL